ncbi:MAG: TatD family hydrolase, partial [bacterium]
GKIVAVGEIGLDYHYKHSPIAQQKAVFARFLQLAQELDLPAIIHVREASEDAIALLESENNGKLKGVLHCFSGDPELAKAALDMGLMISYTANCTFPKATLVRDSIKFVPLENIMIETDCPFLAPQAFRGKRNEPSYVIKVAEQIAEVKGISVEEVARKTTKNAKQFFRI